MLSLMPFIPMSFNDAFKTGVVVVRIKAVVDLPRRAAADDAACTSIPGPRCPNRVLVVVAARPPRQHPFEVAEYDAVLAIPIRPAGCDRVQRFARLARQLRRSNAGASPIRCRRRRRDGLAGK